MDSIALGGPQPGFSAIALVDDNHDELGSPVEQILQALSDGEGATRQDLARRTGLPRSTVSAVVRKLVAEGEVTEFSHASSTGGRRPALIQLAQRIGTVYVAELGSHHANIGLATLSGELLKTESLPLDITAGPQKVIPILTEAWRSFEVPRKSPALAIGLSVPGPVSAQGLIAGAARMPGWNGIDLTTALAGETELPVVIENDARAGAIGEWSARGEHTESCIYIKAGTGVGAGWISGGLAHRGTHGFAGDITHIRVQTDHPTPCSCGNSGCLETVASGAAILRQLAALGSPISTLPEVITTANGGDPMATSLVRDAGARIGEVLSGLVNFLNPKRIVLGGSMSQVGALLAGVRTELYDRCLPTCTQHLAIETSLAGADAPLLGMTVLARQQLATLSRSQE